MWPRNLGRIVTSRARLLAEPATLLRGHCAAGSGSHTKPGPASLGGRRCQTAMSPQATRVQEWTRVRRLTTTTPATETTGAGIPHAQVQDSQDRELEKEIKGIKQQLRKLLEPVTPHEQMQLQLEYLTTSPQQPPSSDMDTSGAGGPPLDEHRGVGQSEDAHTTWQHEKRIKRRPKWADWQARRLSITKRKKLLAGTKEIATRVIDDERIKDPEIYGMLVLCFEKCEHLHKMKGMLKLMIERGMRPSINLYRHIVRAFALEVLPELIYGVVDMVEKQFVEPWQPAEKRAMTGICSDLVIALVKHNQPELAWRVYQDKLVQRGLVPTPACFNYLVTGLGEIGEVKEAYQCIDTAVGQGIVIQAGTYLSLLRSAAEELDGEVVQYCWDKCVGLYQLIPTEGDILQVLTTAARWGNIELARSCLLVLEEKGIAIKDYHLEALFEAIVTSHDWARMFEMLQHMRESGMGYERGLFKKLTRELVRGRGKRGNTPEGVYEIMRDVSAKYPLVAADGLVVNALLETMVIEGRLGEALEKTKEWFHELGIKRTLDTYHVLLQGCETEGNKTAAEVLFTSLRERDGLSPVPQTYTLMVNVCLSQKNYEDAFLFLEAMKAHNIVPPATLYVNMAKRCAVENDPRGARLLDEMRTIFGYRVSARVQQFVETGGRSEQRYIDDALGVRKSWPFPRYGSGSGSNNDTEWEMEPEPEPESVLPEEYSDNHGHVTDRDSSNSSSRDVKG